MTPIFAQDNGIYHAATGWKTPSMTLGVAFSYPETYAVLVHVGVTAGTEQEVTEEAGLG